MFWIFSFLFFRSFFASPARRYALAQKILAGFVLFFSVMSFAAQGDDFSAREILIQALNFSLFAGLLYFFLRKPAQTFFHKRREDFLFLEREALQQEKVKKRN